MNRNSENHFAVNPQVDIGRSCFRRNSDHKTTFDAGDLIPIYVDEVLPGDTFSMDMSALVRMTTPIFPTMDNAAIDFYFFYTPTRILWDHWKELNGENRETAWAQKVEYSVPQVKMTKADHPGGWDTGSIADYMGIPTKVTDISVNALPFRAYGMIWNEFFRNQNTTAPTLVETDDSDIEGSSDGSDSNKQAIKGGKPLKAEKYFDYFTGCLPAPQKGEPVTLPMSGNAPVKMYSAEGQGINGPTRPANIFLYQAQANASQLNEEGAVRLSGTSDKGGAGAAVTRYLAVDLKNITGATINQLRQAFQIQKLLEKDARGGTRYREVLREHFGVISPDSRQQVPEYLGGYRMPINVNQVVQTSQTSSESPQGNVAAMSVTTMNQSMFTKSFTEHGYIIGLAVARYDQTYQQGLERMWSRKTRFDYYWPALANIGEQAVLNKEIYFQGNTKDDEAFGYQEAWADYRYKPSRVSGKFRSNAEGTLDSWHYAQKYEALPTLTSDWMHAGNAELKRTLAVQDEPNFIGDFYFMCKTTRAMPVFSIPGLIDHH
nr:MAG: major capsid protein [Microvirus sp.]